MLIRPDGVTNASKYKYPSPLVLTDNIALSTIALANLGSPAVRRDEEWACSHESSIDEVSIPEQQDENISIDQS